MNLLRAAADWARARPDIPPAGYAYRKVYWELRLDQDGTPVGNLQELTTEGAKDGNVSPGRELCGPERKRPGPKPPANLVHDKPQYLFGLHLPVHENRRPDIEWRHNSYIDVLDRAIEATGNPQLKSVRAFITGGHARQLTLPDEMVAWFSTPTKQGTAGAAEGVIQVLVDGIDPTASPDVAAWWAAEATTVASTRTVCSVCGELRAPQLKWPNLKNVQGGMGIVTLATDQGDCFIRYGRGINESSGVCPVCVHLAHSALNMMLASTEHSYRPRGFNSTLLYWARDGSDAFDLANALAAKPEHVTQLLRQADTGKQKKVGVSSADFHMATLVGSAGRAVVKSYSATSLDDVQRNLRRWFGRLQVNTGFGDRYPDQFPSIRTLLWAASRTEESKDGEAELIARDAERLLPGLLDAALHGRPAPKALLPAVVARVRAERNVTASQAAALKLCLIHHNHPSPGDHMTVLDPHHPSVAYHCGRALAVIANIQYLASQDVNANVVDRFYGAASTRPLAAFPRLITTAQAHLSKIRRGSRAGAAVNCNNNLEEILGHIPAWPAVLDLKQQGEFALGFYHQNAHDRARRIAASASTDNQTPEPTQEGTDLT